MAITKINTPEIFDLGSANTSVQLPSGNTASRPTSASAGEWRYNTDDNKVEYYDGSDWFQVDDEALPLPANFPGLNFNTNTYVGNGATQAVNAKFNEAAVFNGSSSKIDLPNFMPSGNAARSISMWIKTTQTTAATLLQYGGGNTNLLFNLRINDGGAGGGANTIGIGFYANDFNRPATGLMDDDWHHIAATYDGTNAKIYIDGVQTGADFATGGINTTASSGLIGSNGGSFIFNGKIDQVRIYNTALTGTQVNNLYKNETTTTAGTLNFPTGAGCIAAYQLDGDASDVGGTYGGVPTDIGYTGLQFEPDLVWIKGRNYSDSHALIDSVRGANKILFSNSVSQQGSYSNTLTSFDNNGFTLGADATNLVNYDTKTYAAWCWKAASSDSTNTDGAIPSTVRANQDAGFSIVKWTTTSAAAWNVGHGLSSAPEMIISKTSSFSNAWEVYHKDAGTGKYLILNSNAAVGTDAGAFSSVTNTTWTSYTTNTLATYIAYCFHSVDGYQKVGSYTGNGSTNGTIVEIGFEPAFIMTKGLDGDRWLIADNKRHEAVNNNAFLDPSDSHVESSFGTGNGVTFLSNGFQLKSNDNVLNGTGKEYIYLAIAADAQPAPVLADSFQPVIYTGNGGTQSIATDFQPDLVWIKDRVGTDNHHLFDSIRGTNQRIISNSTAAENTEVDALNSFDENGFTIGANSGVNASGENHVAWCWKAGGIPKINTEGSITSLTSANPAAGFSIVSLNKTDLNTRTYGHGLSSAPEMIILKRTASADDWYVYHKDLGNTVRISLNSSAAKVTGTGVWGSTTPTSSVFTLQNQSGGAHIAYCFTSITGYQSVGSYTGSTSGVSENIGFKPRFMLIKNVDSNYNWGVFDSLRPTSSGGRNYLYPDLSANEDSYSGSLSALTFTSTGFSIDNTNSAMINENLSTFIYLAIA